MGFKSVPARPAAKPREGELNISYNAREGKGQLSLSLSLGWVRDE